MAVPQRRSEKKETRSGELYQLKMQKKDISNADR